MGTHTYICQWCAKQFERPTRRGPNPKYCSDSHRQLAYQLRVKLAESIRQQYARRQV